MELDYDNFHLMMVDIISVLPNGSGLTKATDWHSYYTHMGILRPDYIFSDLYFLVLVFNSHGLVYYK